MKFNWGTGIVIAMVLFIGYIMSMVVIMISTHTDIVEVDYYAQQVDYQKTKEAIENGLQIKESVVFLQEQENVQIIFPNEANLENVNKGEVHFYRPENAALDRKYEIKTGGGNTLNVPMNQLKTGTYQVKIRWENNTDEYYIEKPITIK